MKEYLEKNFRFCFEDSCEVLKYDECDYHKSVASKSKKAVDFVMYEETDDKKLWFIEAKDFRIITREPNESNFENLPQTLLQKYRDTSDGLKNLETQTQLTDSAFAKNANTKEAHQLVLHVEPNTSEFSKKYGFKITRQLNEKLKALSKETPLAVSVFVMSKKFKPKRERIPWEVEFKI